MTTDTALGVTKLVAKDKGAPSTVACARLLTGGLVQSPWTRYRML